jgi:tetratricopeptide (TPR) repeat protein
VRIRLLIVVFVVLASISWAQESPDKPAPNQDPPRSDTSQGSSSQDTIIDISPPPDDAKNHPKSKDAIAGLDDADNSDTSGIQEFHPWNPMKAMKDIEIGDFYFRRKNYKGALERYEDALYNKTGDAVAISRLATCEKKLGDNDAARKYYEQYLKILPDGPFAKEARASLEKLPKDE